MDGALARYGIVVALAVSACAAGPEEECSPDGWCRELAMLDGIPTRETFREAWTDGTTIFVIASEGGLPSRMWRFDGGSWAPETSVPVAPSHVAGTSTADLWVSSGARILHYDGASWSDTLTVEEARPIVALWASAPDDAWAATGSGTVLHWNGVAWVPWVTWVPSESASGSTITAFGGTAGDDVWIAEDLWYPSARAVVWHWDGESLTRATEFGSWRHDNPRVAIAPISRGSAWLGVFDRITEVGTSSDSGTRFCTDVGYGWCDDMDPHMAMAREPGGRVWATRSRGTMLTYDGATWAASETGATTRLLAFVSSSTGVVRAFGEAGTILRHGAE